MWKAASKAFGEAILDVLRAWGGCISQDVRKTYQWGITEGDIGPFVRATYVHLGRTAAIILAPSTPRLFDTRLRLVMALISEDVVGTMFSGG
jgi:hypothetical protein